MGRRGSRGWGWAGGTGRAGGKLSGLIALEALTVSLFTRDPSRSAPRAEPSPAPLCSSGGEGCAGSRCSAPSLCSIPPLVWGGSSGVRSELSPRTMGGGSGVPGISAQIPATVAGCWECSSPQSPLISAGLGPALPAGQCHPPLCPFVPPETAALPQHSQVFS